MLNSKVIYQNRFNKKEQLKRNLLWQTLNQFYFQQFIKPNDVVMDIAAGYCEFINNIHAKRRIAVDINPDINIFADKKIEIINTNIFKIPKTYFNQINCIFISNFLEHLDNKEEIVQLLNLCHKILKKNGRILILQPNIDLAKEKYWDCFDHKVPLNSNSMIEALEISEFKNIKAVTRFLPFTTKSSLPIIPLFVKIYLMLPPKIRPFAGQSLFIAQK